MDRRADGDLGRRIRTLREGRGLSLRALGRAWELTPAALSQIENGRKLPVGEYARARAARPGHDAGGVFTAQEPAREESGYVIRTRQLVNVAAGAGLRYLAPPGAGAGKSIQIMHEVYEPGTDTGPKPYVHEGEEAGFCIMGSIEVTIGGRCEVLRPGDAYYFPVEPASPLAQCREGQGP